MNPQVFRLFDQVFNLGDLEDLPQLLSPDCQNSTSFIAKLPPGPAGFAPFVAVLRDVFGQLFFELSTPSDNLPHTSTQTQTGNLAEKHPLHLYKGFSAKPLNPQSETSSFCSDEIITVQFCLHGLHRAELFWIEPTGRTISLPGEYRARVRGGQIIEQHLELSVQALMQQLGVETSRRNRGQQ